MQTKPQLPVRASWFERREVAQGITWLLEPSVHGFLRSNIWHVRGRDRDLVIDTGTGIAPLRPTFPDLFDTDTVAFITHGHYDHTGGAHEFGRRSSHRAEAVMLAEPEEATLITADLPASFADAMAADDPDGVAPAYLVDAVPFAGYDVTSYVVAPAPVTDPLLDGDTIDLGDRVFEVVHLPGHTPGSAALYDADAGVLFTGDVLYDGELLDELPESNVDDYVDSMRRLLALNASIAYAGHEQPLTRDDIQRLGSAYLTHRTASSG